MPIIAPAFSMKPGHNKPSSNDSTVPDTAPTAKRIAVPRAHRLLRSRYTGCRVRRYIPSAMAMSNGIPMPSAAKTMWKASDMAICERAKKKSVMRQPFSLFSSQFGGIGFVMAWYIMSSLRNGGPYSS